ncbi:MAG: ATP-independent RNA helicase DbpA [Chlamydiales bacterium]|jgi:ATP-independent RNA helicase DbpA
MASPGQVPRRLGKRQLCRSLPCAMVADVKPAFDSLSLSPALLAVIDDLGYTQPTPIQAASIPALLAGQDLIGQSKTGSGKTAAFALPILQRMELEQRALQALVLCPTRELCAQVARELRKLGRACAGLHVLEVVGGQPARPQREALERGVHVAIGTPGRLLDHLQRGALDTRSIQTVVLDEADRMLDMGFEEDVRKILRALPAARQTVLFSATFPDSVDAMSRAHQNDALRVTIDDPEEALLEIHQLQMAVELSDKLHALCWLLHTYPHESALVFCNFKATVSELARSLSGSGLSVDRLDGDLDQFHRDQVLARFRNKSVRVLIATDVAGRGIDVEGLDLVINFELPPQAEVYVHRIGRTGRAGRKGVAVSLTTGPRDSRIQAAEQLTGEPIETLARDSGSDPGLEALLKALAVGPEMETILISGGRKDRVRPGDILGALTGDAGGLRAGDVGKIEIQEKLSYVAVSRRVSDNAVERINSGRIKGKRFRATLVGAVWASAQRKRGGRRDRP